MSHGAGMAHFKEVLDSVNLALSSASPAEIQALLTALVKEQIISEAYSKSLNLRQRGSGHAGETLGSGTAFEAASDAMNYPEPANRLGRDYATTCYRQTGLESASPAADCYRTARGPNTHPPLRNEHGLDHRFFAAPTHGHQFRLDDCMTEVLRGTGTKQKAESDSESIREGNSEEDKEWLEQVEQAARRLAVPLWQHWDSARRMLLPLVPSVPTSVNATVAEAQCPLLNLEKETELTPAYRTLELCAAVTDSTFALDEATVAPEGLEISAYDGAVTAAPGTGCFSVFGERSNTSRVKAWGEDTKDMAEEVSESGLHGCQLADRSKDTTQDLLYMTLSLTDAADIDCSTRSFTDEERLYTHWVTCIGNQKCSTLYFFCVLLILGSVFSYVSFMQTLKNQITDTLLIPLPGAKMQRLDQDPYISPDVGVLPGVKIQEVDNDLPGCSEFGDLPEDISEFLNEDFLRDIVDSDTLFDGLNCEDELYNCGDLSLPGGLPATDNHLQGQEEELAVQPDKRRKRPRVPQSQLSTNESTPQRPKRQRVPGRLNRKVPQVEPTVTQGSVTHSEPSPTDVADLSTTPPRILQLHHPIQFIAIPDTPGYPIVQALSFSPPVIGLPIPNSAATPTYILVPAASPPAKQYVPPLSPVDGAVAPVQMSSSPPGSLSDTASKAMSPSCASPLSPNNEMSACKESPLPQSVLDIPHVVKDYIQEMKAHMSQTCQNMEESLSLTSHYIDAQVSQRDVVYRCGRNTHKFLDKELIIMGDTDRKQSLLGRSQIFQGSSGVKNKRCILLLGNAGMGKTTLIKKLCLDWSRDCIPQFDFVFLLDGKALTLKQPSFSLQTLLLNLSAFAPPCSDLDTVFAQITAAPKRVLIFFDGFDELRDYETLLQPQEKDLMTSLQRDSKAQTFTVKQLYSALLQRVLLPGCTLLLSARPRGTATQLLRRTDRFFEVCGFSSADIETYVSRYFEDPVLGASALDCLKSCEYLRLLCWNPGLCRLVCLLLELSRNAEVLPKTLTELCNKVIHLKMKKYTDTTLSPAELEKETTEQAGGAHTHISSSSQGKRSCRNAEATPTTWVRTQRARRGKKQERKGGEAVGEGGKSVDGHVGRTEERELLSQLSALAWDGVKGNSCILNTERKISFKLKVFGLRTGLLTSNDLRTGQADSRGKKGTQKEETQNNRTGTNGKSESKNTEVRGGDAIHDDVLLWSSPFLQSYLAAVHLSLSRTVSDRVFLQSLPFLSAPKGRRRPQWETLELTQRFAFGFLFYSRTELQLFHSYTEAAFTDMLLSKQALVTKHLEDFSRCDLMPAQVLEACHYIYEATLKHSGDSRERGCTELIDQLAATLPEVLTFRGVPLNPSDVFAVQNLLERGGYEGQKFCLDLEDSGIQISGLKTLVEHSNIKTYRACIADAITLWEQLEQSDDERQKAVAKFKINPLKATQVCHIDHLAKLVNVHVNKRLSNSSRQCDFIFAEGVPAVQELHKLEFELGPENGPKALPQLWELLPGLHNLQHLDLENSKIGDGGAEELARALVSLCLLEVLNLSQNCIGDPGVRTLANMLKDLPKLHCLSLYSNVISDEGAKSLAAVLPHMTSLTDLDVRYNKLTDVGAQSLGVSLRNCKTLKTLRMWNQCIPYGVFERLQQQDSRILLH